MCFSSKLSEGVMGIFIKCKFDDDIFEEFEDLLILFDFGVVIVVKISVSFVEGCYDKEIVFEEVCKVFVDEIVNVFGLIE